MNNELVSVVMAVHNVEPYIIEALKSVQAQTYNNFECIIVDDHSTDSTINVIYDNFCKIDNRFKLCVNCTDPSKPYVDAHNVSYSLGKGKYLIRFDGDDIMHPNHIETIVKEMDDHPEYDAVCTNIHRVSLNSDGILCDDISLTTIPGWGRRQDDSISEKNIETFNKFPDWQYKENTLSWFNQASAIRKSFYDIYHPKFEVLKNGDYVFWWSMLSIGAKLHKLNDITLDYRMHTDSICHSDLFKTWKLEDDCDFQIMLALYKANSFSRYPKGTMFPDGTLSHDNMKVFQNTAEYFKKYKETHIQHE
jgi:glycosyltransferase involved in cell wall biosynthesis